MQWEQRFTCLEALLLQHQHLWQAQPFRQLRPEWCQHYPALTQALLALDDSELAHLGNDAAALHKLLSHYLPSVEPLLTLSDLASTPQRLAEDPGPHFANHIPGRKWQQITAFAHAMAHSDAPLLEWCGGQGHLGRLLGRQYRQPVLTLERDAQLCARGEELAHRNTVEQRFVRVDVLSAKAASLLSGHHVVALHACGELHRKLLHEVVAQRVPALDLAPCCYHHLLQADYVPLSRHAVLSLRRDDVRLAVTGAATASAGELRRRDQEMAWKLAYLTLLQQQGETYYRPIRPIEKAWLHLDFIGFCHKLASREGDLIHSATDWQALEATGWQRQGETMRLSLLRQGFSRAIEVWLVLDLACFLEQHGYQVGLGTFCTRELTPRNLLLSARLATDTAMT